MRAYRLAYDGQPYHGFQRQPDVETVEDTLIAALTALGVTDGEVPPGYAAAGRTDAGVSARAQTIAFEAPEWLSPLAFNSELPDSIRVWAHTDAPADFHATHHATEREYTYFLYAEDASESRVKQSLDRLAGEHDFHNLTPDDTGTTRELTTSLDRDGTFFVLRFRAGGFPRQFVRRAVSLVSAVARGDREPTVLDRVLSPEELSGPDGIAPAPPTPLVMTDVSYTDIEFTADEKALQQTQRIFEKTHRQRASEAHVAAVLSRAEHNADRS